MAVKIVQCIGLMYVVGPNFFAHTQIMRWECNDHGIVRASPLLESQ